MTGAVEALYVGQTGNSLRARLGHLGGIYRDVMPYRDPHTAAPALWACRQESGCDFEVSVASVDGSAQWRKALEVTAITLHRLAFGASPGANFGRMPTGYVQSSGNNAQLKAAGKVFRGFADASVPASAASVHPCAGLDRDSQARDWSGLPWTPWVPWKEARTVAVGVYRVRASGQRGLVYVGQGSIASRLRSHEAKSRREGHRQAEFFRADCEVSWAAVDHDRVGLLEVENDLIASHVLTEGQSPSAQFLG